MLNQDNYYQASEYFSVSLFKQFQKCPACAMATLRGEWKPEKSKALLLGSFVDEALTGTEESMREFLTKNERDIYKKGGGKYAEFAQAEEAIELIRKQPLMMQYLTGEHQKIMTGEIEGVPFKIKIDSYHKGRAIVDLKVIRDFQPIWDDDRGCKLDFIHYWGYDYQAAIYQAIEGNKLPFYICAVTKEAQPDLAVIHIPQAWIDSAMAEIRNAIPLIDAIKRGEIEPERCERCDYCRATKRLSRVISADELESD